MANEKAPPKTEPPKHPPAEAAGKPKHTGQPGTAAGAGGPDHGQGPPSQDPQFTPGPHPGQPSANPATVPLPPHSENKTTGGAHMSGRGAL
jgi:hypothetical protein